MNYLLNYVMNYLMKYVMNYCVRVYIPNWLKSAITGLGMEPSSGLL